MCGKTSAEKTHCISETLLLCKQTHACLPPQVPLTPDLAPVGPPTPS